MTSTLLSQQIFCCSCLVHGRESLHQKLICSSTWRRTLQSSKGMVRSSLDSVMRQLIIQDRDIPGTCLGRVQPMLPMALWRKQYILTSCHLSEVPQTILSKRWATPIWNQIYCINCMYIFHFNILTFVYSTLYWYVCRSIQWIFWFIYYI